MGMDVGDVGAVSTRVFSSSPIYALRIIIGLSLYRWGDVGVSSVVWMAVGFSLWNREISLGTFTWSWGSHESWMCEYPCHFSRYCSFFPHPARLDTNTSSTSYSSSPSTISGGGSSKFA